MAVLCIRCGSKDHSTRDHDEGKYNSALQLTSAAHKRNQLAKQNGSQHGKESGVVQHRACWKSAGHNPGIPELFEKPLRDPYVERRYVDEMTCTAHETCPCYACEQKRRKRELELARRLGKSQ